MRKYYGTKLSIIAVTLGAGLAATIIGHFILAFVSLSICGIEVYSVAQIERKLRRSKNTLASMRRRRRRVIRKLAWASVEDTEDGARASVVLNRMVFGEESNVIPFPVG